jgi:type III secretion system HrpE/YscL family protein
VSRVIKAGSDAPVRRAIVEAPVFDAKMEAERLLSEARGEAERIVAEARHEAERLRSKAATEGREKGLAAVTELLVGARAAAARARDEAESELRSLAVRISEKILGRELKLSPDAVEDVVAQALEHAGEPRDVVVRLNPADLEAVERGKPRLLERVRSARAVSLRGDDAVPRGGCVVETELGIVDARLSTQLEAIERALRGDRE